MYHRGHEQQGKHKPSRRQRRQSQSSSVEAQAPQEPAPAQVVGSNNGPCALAQRRVARNPELERKLVQMALPLAPLVQITTGHVHPAFPMTLLNFWLLTDDQLESLAHFYHQRTPSCWSSQYPCPVRWRSDLPLEEKRRKIGKFIGLRGCESPIVLKTAEELMDEARRQAALAEGDDEAFKRKFGFYR